MKHKRQTLSKEDGDEKDDSTSDGLEKPKSDKILSLEDEKKSCHNCDISGVSDVGSTLTGDVTDLGPSDRRSNNNNTPGATNNNNNNNNNNSNPGFNTNSNGASSIGSTNSVSSSLEKIIADDDSRSQDGSEVTSLTKKSSSEVRIKVEGGQKSPNITKQQTISVSRKSPSVNTKDMCSMNSNGVLLAMPDSTVNTPVLPGQNSTRSLTPSSTPGTPVSVQLQQGSPLDIQQSTHTAYMQKPRSSPSSTTSLSGPMLHGTANPRTMSPHGSRNIPNSQQTHFPQQNVYQPMLAIDYRNGVSANRQNVPAANNQQTQSQSGYCTRDTYQQPRISYSGEVHPLYVRQNQVVGARIAHHVRASGTAQRSMYNANMQFQQQQSQYGNTEYNGYPQSGPPYHASYHRSIQGTNTYNSGQGYSSTSSHSEQGTDSYMTSGNYGYSSGNYHGGSSSENLSTHGHAAISVQTGQHYYNDIQQQQQHPQQHTAEGYVTHQPSMHPSSNDYRTGNKCQTSAYYEQMHLHQGGEASSIPNSYVSSPDPFPAPGMTTTATAIAAATAAVITPSGNDAQQTDSNNESYGNYGHFYGEPVHTAAPPQSADNSNSSSDFNFLSNLATEFVPEYYQLS